MAVLNISEVDFFKIKQNLKTMYQSQAEFSDFDFEGSAINILLDSLAYTSHYAAVHLNMAVSEMFLDTAQLRSSVVSNAKELGYMPSQMNAATATVNLSITPVDAPANVSVPIGTEFVVNVDGKNFIFTTDQSYLLTNDGNGTYSGDVIITQGKLMREQWTYNATNPSQQFIILNSNIDTNTLTMNIQYNASGGAITTWTKASSIVPLTKTSTNYFLQETATSAVEIYFGDGIIGQKPVHNNLIQISYISTDGSLGNNLSVFTLSNAIQGYSVDQFTLTTVSASAGGADKESIESIKISSPLNYAAQNRAVVPSDYESIVRNQFGFIESLSVWGGENNVPPQYGKVFLSAKPTYGNILSDTTKANIITYLQSLNIVGITPSIVNAEFVYVNVVTDVEYYESKTTDFIGDIKSKVTSNINNFFTANLVAFGSELVYSDLVGTISAASLAIKGNLTKLSLSKYLTPSNVNPTSSLLDYANAIVASSVSSKTWTFNGNTYQLKDDGAGVMHEYINGVRNDVLGQLGTVDYAAGVVSIAAYQFNIDANTEIFIAADVAKNNILSARNTLIRIDAISPVVNVVGIK